MDELKESDGMSILEAIREQIGAKSMKTVVREAENALDKIRALIAAPEKRLAEAEENVAQRKAQLKAAEAYAVSCALAGNEVPDHTALQGALLHEKNTVNACFTALEQVRAEQKPALQAALDELSRAQIAERKLHFERAARRFRESWVVSIKAHQEMIEAYIPWEHEQLSIQSFGDMRQLEPWDEAFNRFFGRPAKAKAEDHPKQVVRFIHNWDKWSGAPEGGDEACMNSEEEAFQAVVAGAAVYKFDVLATQELTAKAVEERGRLRKYPPTSEDFPQQN